MNRGILVVLSGPSGTGKDSILKEMLKDRDDFKVSISCTTRKPRAGEIHGKDYFFVDKQEFMEMVNQGQMLEWATFCDNFYGTPRQEIDGLLQNGVNVLLEIEVQGAKQIIQKCSEAVSIFVLPPSIATLQRRLESRGLDSPGMIEKRIAASKNEIILAYDYNYVVVNDNLNDCAQNILKIIDAEKMKTKHQSNIIKGVLDDERIVSR